MNEKDILLLTKYLNNECTEHELIRVAELLTSPSNQEQVAELLEQASKKFRGHFKTSPAHQERSWLKIHSEISSYRNIPKKSSQIYQTWLKVAALVILLIGVGLLIRLSIYHTGNSIEKVAVQMKTVSNELGEKSKLTLPDGTIVIMNSGTKITYPEKFDSQMRFVSLTGEAYFDVREDSSRSFVVNVQGLKVKVLGTTFNIRAYNYYSNVKVSLTSGKVTMQLPDDPAHLVLEPGQEMIYDLSVSTYKLSEFDSEKVLGWQRGILHFDEASEQEVINILEHWYNVDIETVGSSSKEWTNLTAEYDNESLENVLISLGYTLDFNYQINGKNIKIIYN
ncbi:MAG: FecR domain-containing protein [Cytophagales bacterium]|nr:FecR domain-containing protein [Cytophagales bacterium]